MVADGDDDAAEKRRRRKSHYMDDDNNKNSPAHKSKNANGASRVARHKLATTIAPQPAGNAPALSMDVMTTNFEEWMKMATDNVRHGFCTIYILTESRKLTLQTRGTSR